MRNDAGQPIIKCQEIDVLVDEDLWQELSKYTWRLNGGYLVGYVKGKTMSMHQYIMSLKGHDLSLISENNCYIDHINGIKHDNRIENLRVNTTSGNAHNRRKNSTATSQYHGVSYDKSRLKWQVQITKDHKKHFGGRHNTEKEAAIAYNQLAVELYGEFAQLNII